MDKRYPRMTEPPGCSSMERCARQRKRLLSQRPAVGNWRNPRDNGPRPWRVLAAIAVVAWAVGCGGKPLKLVPAEGTVTIGGVPAANIALQFLPDTNGEVQTPSSQGLTNAEGRFALMSQTGQPGAVPGWHSVLLVDTEEERVEQGRRPTGPRRLPRLSDRFATLAAGLRAEVPPEGGSEILIELPAYRR
jgi:hypothetical protein